MSPRSPTEDVSADVRRLSVALVCCCLCLLPSGGVVATTSHGDVTTTSNVTASMENATSRCRVMTTDSGMIQRVVDILERRAKLVEYNFSVKNYTVNPLSTGNTWMYKSHMWSRVGSSHGQTILNLAFNYDVLSLMTLSFGVEQFAVQLQDQPQGCLGKLNETDKVAVVLELVLRDLDANGPVAVVEGDSTVCHQVIVETDMNFAKFTDRCCYRRLADGDTLCFTGIPNKWLQILEVLLATLHMAVFVFGPVMIPGWMYTAVLDTVDYVIKLKEPLYKTMCVSRTEGVQTDVKAKHVLDLRSRKNFRRCRKILAELPAGMEIPIKISRFDIRVNYRKLLPENKVPVGMVECITRAVFLCKLRDLEPFRDCCDANLLTGCRAAPTVPWIHVCNYIGRLMLVLLVPIPFYVRLCLYYLFEHPEITQRHAAARRLGLVLHYNYRLLQYLTPTHPIFVAAYIIFLSTGLMLVYFSGKDKKTRFQQVVIDAFVDMKELSMLKALGLAISNCLWPFKRFGMFGCLIGIVYWPLIMPISAVVCVVYCLPLVFLTCRIVRHTFGSHTRTSVTEGVQTFAAETLLKTIESRDLIAPPRDCYCSLKVHRHALNLFLSATALFTLYSVMLMLAEVIGFIAEVLCFTLMGIIVNASNVLKYGSLIFLVVIYSYDCYNNVNKKYLKLNKDLFSEVKGRLGRDIDDFTSLPSYLQENRGFKACEASQQADYESTDDISDTVPRGDNTSYYWDINDLILFVDSEDNPRIPKKLFDDVCQIRVAGSPGPVYRSLLQATGKFLMIVCFLVFVFIVVLSFGDTYKISSTNQMLATMAGGFMPFIFSNILKPASPLVETKLVSFKSKLEEIIINFCQPWPMDDFVFDVEREPLSSDSEDDGDDDGGGGSSRSSRGNGRCCSCCACHHDKGHHDKGKNSGKKHDDKKKDKDKDKDKDKRNNGDTKPGSNGTKGTKLDNDEVDVDAIRTVLEELELEPAEGREVDILVYVSEADYEWDLEWSTIDENEPTWSPSPPPITLVYGGGGGGHIDYNHVGDTIV